MIESYFFIPANHPKIEEKLQTIQADYFIIDLEDAFDKKHAERSNIFLKNIQPKQNLWVRPKLFERNQLNKDELKNLINIGFSNFVLPKVGNIDHLKQIEKIVSEGVNVILLVENPECLHNLALMIEKTKLQIVSIGFGSQDYCLESGMKHESNLLRYPRFIISNTAKAYGIKCIDIACMEILNESIFIKELEESISMGYNGKFIIHPSQLNAVNTYAFYSQREIEEAEKVLQQYELLGKPSVFQYNGKAIEPPHIKKYLEIQFWRDKYGKK